VSLLNTCSSNLLVSCVLLQPHRTATDSSNGIKYFANDLRGHRSMLLHSRKTFVVLSKHVINVAYVIFQL